MAACRDCGSTRLIDGTPRVARARVVSTEPLGIQFIGDSGSEATEVIQLAEDEIIVVEVAPNSWAQLPALAKDTPADKFPEPSLEQLTKASVRVSWAAFVTGTGLDVQAADDTSGTNARTVGTGVTDDHVDDTGLDEQSTHYYRVGRSAKWGPWASITLTLDNTGVPGLDTELDKPPGEGSCTVTDGVLSICWGAPAPPVECDVPTTGWTVICTDDDGWNVYGSGGWQISTGGAGTTLEFVYIMAPTAQTERPNGVKITIAGATFTVGRDWGSGSWTAAQWNCEMAIPAGWGKRFYASGAGPSPTEWNKGVTVTCPEPPADCDCGGVWTQTRHTSTFAEFKPTGLDCSKGPTDAQLATTSTIIFYFRDAADLAALTDGWGTIAGATVTFGEIDAITLPPFTDITTNTRDAWHYASGPYRVIYMGATFAMAPETMAITCPEPAAGIVGDWTDEGVKRVGFIVWRFGNWFMYPTSFNTVRGDRVVRRVKLGTSVANAEQPPEVDWQFSGSRRFDGPNSSWASDDGDEENYGIQTGWAIALSRTMSLAVWNGGLTTQAAASLRGLGGCG